MRAAILAVVLLLVTLLGGEPPAQAQAAQAGYTADGLYNLANSYARAGKPGMAVLNYERAALLAPEDADIQANLSAVRAAAHLPPQPRSRAQRMVELMSPDAVAWLSVLGLLMVGAGLLAAKRAPRLRALCLASVALGIAAMGFTLSNALVQSAKLREAVVIVKETPMRVSPVPMGDELLQLPEAETVTVTAEHEDFVLVSTRSGRSGWAARADVADVVPKQPNR